MENEGINGSGSWDGFLERQVAIFKDRHEPTHCEYCGSEIYPGEDIWIFGDNTYCDGECAALSLGAKEVGVGQTGYDQHFKIKEKEHAQ